MSGIEHGDVSGSVFNRLYEESQHLRAKLREKRKQIQKEVGITFAPAISSKSREIADMQRSAEKDAAVEARRSRSRGAACRG